MYIFSHWDELTMLACCAAYKSKGYFPSLRVIWGLEIILFSFFVWLSFLSSHFPYLAVEKETLSLQMIHSKQNFNFYLFWHKVLTQTKNLSQAQSAKISHCKVKTHDHIEFYHANFTDTILSFLIKLEKPVKAC